MCYLVSILLFLVAASLAASKSSTGSTLIVDLPDAQYQGFFNATSNLDVWLGIRYAAPPTGINRWMEAKSPLINTSTPKQMIQANVLPKQCPQNTANFTEDSDDEDCLFLNVFAPPNANDLPVLVWIHGGSWDHNSAKEFDPTPMINLANNSFVAVIVQYRLGLFGFLAGSSDITPNLGIKDARFSLQWVQSNIHLFGGSKDRVTIWGQSSGGGTILELVAQESYQASTINGPLFHASVLSSPWLPPLGNCGDDFFVQQFTNISTAAGCPNNATCLRSLPSTTLKSLNHQFSVPAPHRVNYFTACIEGSKGYIQQHPIKSLLEGTVFGDVTLTGSNAFDGTGTTPSNLSTPSQFQNFLTANFPITTPSLIDQIDALYPSDAFSDSHERGTVVYQDIIFTCPANWVSEAFDAGTGAKEGGRSWRYLFAVPPAKHAQDNAYEFPIWYNTLSPPSSTFFASFTGEITSFIRFFDPNVDRPSGSDQLEWREVSKGMMKVFNMTMEGENEVEVRLEKMGVDALAGTKERCDFWAKVRMMDNW